VERPTPKIMGGVKVEKDKYPWYVSVNGNCGGGLISDRHVLTSAHCIPKNQDPDTMRIVLGLHNLDDFWYKTQRRLEVEDYIVHEKYNYSYFDKTTNENIPGSFYYDIAIIKLKKSLESDFETTDLNPICLPDFDETDNLFVYGHGFQTRGNEIVTAKHLHEASLDRVSPDECKRFWGSMYNEDLTICTLNHKSNQNICRGDSGSPLSTKRDFRVYEVGIPSMAFPMECNVNNTLYPSGFEKVYAHLEWIKTNTRDAIFCEGPHHPFMKPFTSLTSFQTPLINSSINHGRMQFIDGCVCGDSKNISMEEVGKNPWDVEIRTHESLQEPIYFSHGVLISDRHILVSASKVNDGSKLLSVRLFDGRPVGPINAIHGLRYPETNSVITLIELRYPVNLGRGSLYSTICLLRKDLTSWLQTDSYLGFMDRNFKFTRVNNKGIGMNDCKGISETMNKDYQLCVSYHGRGKDCPNKNNYLVAVLSEGFGYLAGIQESSACGSSCSTTSSFSSWFSIPSLADELEKRMMKSGAQFCPGNFHMFEREMKKN